MEVTILVLGRIKERVIQTSICTLSLGVRSMNCTHCLTRTTTTTTTTSAATATTTTQ